MTFGFRKMGKFNAQKQEYGGLKYDSKLEVGFAKELDARIAAGEKFTWKRQVLFDLRVEGKKICGYKMDFVLDHGNDTFELVETKGFPTPEWKIKWRLLEVLIETDQFRADHGFPKFADLHLTLVAANRVKNWAAGIRNQRRKKRTSK